MPDIKPGWQTTEFWTALATQVITLLMMLGYIGQGDVSTVQGAVLNVVKDSAAIIGAAWTLVAYFKNRAQVKEAVARALTVSFAHPSNQSKIVRI